MTQTVVPARGGAAVEVRQGQVLRLTTPKGGQVADFFAFNAADLGEWLSPPHSWVTTFCVKPRVGDVLISRFRRPMLKMVGDTADGCHDMLIAACDRKRYEFFGCEGHHDNCAENLETAMRALGHDVPVIPQPINFFTNTRVEPDGRLFSPANPVPPGAYIEVEALMDQICAVSSCPFDMQAEGWEVNASAEITELLIDVRDAA